MALQNEKVGHKDLVGGGQTTLHSHAGGGSEIIKAGTVTTAAGVATVTFGTPFADANYFISLTAQDPGDAVIAQYLNKVAGGFDVQSWDDGGKVEPVVLIDWIAIHL